MLAVILVPEVCFCLFFMNNRVLFDLIEATQVGVNLEPSTLSV